MPLSSAQRKLARGIEQVHTLRVEGSEFEDSDAYGFPVERERRSSQEVAYRCFAFERLAPPDYWPLLAGEAIQNLRSALDHAVYALAPKRKRGQTMYPIFTDPCEFQVIGRAYLPGIPEPVRTLIEESQPYRCLPEAPTIDPLEILRTLSNIDKHRELATVASAVNFEWIGVGVATKIREWKFASGKPLGHGKTEISSFVAFTTDGSELDEVEVNPSFSYEVRIEGRPFDVLVPIVERVYRSVTECETGQPLSPLAAYPINRYL